jgi:hypothetical protein
MKLQITFRLLPLIFLIALSLPNTFLTAQSGEWKLEQDNDGLKVYLRDAANSDVKEVKIVTVFDASISTIISVLKDIPAYSDWIYKCENARRLEASTDRSSLYYCEVDFPWPMSNRDFIAKSKLWQDAATKRVYIDVKGLPDYMPQQDEKVRIEDLEIHYEFIPLSNGQVKMIYRLHSDPAGDIPTWLVNMVIENGPINTVKGMREMMGKDKYKNARLSFLED